MIRVNGYQNLYRDEQTGAILNCDSSAYNQYINSLSIRDDQKRQLNEMRNDIDEIKSILRELLNGSK
jgi:flagellar biosynthesis chaperone FliJ